MGDIRLEGFESLGSIRKRKVLVIGKPDDCLRFVGILESESLYRGRTILIGKKGSSLSISLLRRKWDATFFPKENFDYQMIMTYVENAPKPVRIIWTEGDIPRVLINKWTNKDITLISTTEAACEWDAIFFPLHYRADSVEKILSKRGSGIRQLVAGVAASLGEIYEKEAALVWSNIDETDSHGSLYWYDPTEGLTNSSISKEEAKGILEELAGWISNN